MNKLLVTLYNNIISHNTIKGLDFINYKQIKKFVDMMYIRVSINNKCKKQGGCYKEKGIPFKSFIELSKILN